MTPSEAKAVLASVDNLLASWPVRRSDKPTRDHPANTRRISVIALRDALSAMIAEVERLTVPLGDEGRELVDAEVRGGLSELSYADQAMLRNIGGSADILHAKLNEKYDTAKPVPPSGAQPAPDLAKLRREIEAKKTASADLAYNDGLRWVLSILDTAKPANPAPDLAKLRRDVGALLVDEETAEDYGNIEAGWNGAIDAVLALIDQQEAGDE